MGDEWSSGERYEPYVGRWSRLVAQEFVRWLEQPAGLTWLDVGCGTGALSSEILRVASPAKLVGVDPSGAYVDFARRTLTDKVASFEEGVVADLGDDAFDVVVLGLVLNFIPDRGAALARLREIGGTVAAYVWDYAEGMLLMRYFWDAVVELDPHARELHEGLRFGFCRPLELEALFRSAGYRDVVSRGIEVSTVFTSFDDFWSPFLGGQGPAPSYVRGLHDADREALRQALRERLPISADGSIPLTARAWALRGRS